MRKIQSFVLVLLLLLTTLVNQGCFAVMVGAAVGAGGYAYIKGVLEKNFDRPLEEIHQATLDGLRKLGYYVVSDEVNRHDAVVKVLSDKKEDITITIQSLTEKASTIKIRVGIFGHQLKSEHILAAIESKL